MPVDKNDIRTASSEGWHEVLVQGVSVSTALHRTADEAYRDYIKQLLDEIEQLRGSRELSPRTG